MYVKRFSQSIDLFIILKHFIGDRHHRHWETIVKRHDISLFQNVVRPLGGYMQYIQIEWDQRESIAKSLWVSQGRVPRVRGSIWDEIWKLIW